MKFTLMVRARPDADEAVPAKHERAMRRLARLGPPWGVVKDQWPEAREPGTQFASDVSLSRWIGKGIKGSAAYANRKWLPDTAQSDDWISLDFNPTKADYAALVRSGFMAYVQAIDAYVAAIEDLDLILADFDNWQRLKSDARHTVFRIWAVNFFDRQLCRKAFGLTPEVMAKRLRGEVERAEVVEDGLRLVVTSQVLTTKETRKIDRRVRRALGMKGGWRS